MCIVNVYYLYKSLKNLAAYNIVLYNLIFTLLYVHYGSKQ